MWQLELFRERTGDVEPLVTKISGQPLVGGGRIEENSTLFWRLSGPSVDAFRTELTVNGIPLPRDSTSAHELWFPWATGFNSGIADIEIDRLSPGGRVGFRLTVDPARAKLNSREFELMLRDILEDTRSLAATSGFRSLVGRGEHDLPIAIVELVLQHESRIVRWVNDLDSRQRKRLSRQRAESDLSRARRITPKAWNQSLRRSRKVDAEELRGLPPTVSNLVGRSGGRIPRRIVRWESSLSSHRREHEEILGLIHELLKLCGRTARRLSSGPEDTRDLVLAERCTRFTRRLLPLLDLSVFEGLEPALGAWRPSSLYQFTEPYRSLHRVHRDLRSGIGSVGGDFSRVPLRQTPVLYETWVACRLARAAQHLDPGLRAQRLFDDQPESNKLTFRLAGAEIEFAGSKLLFKPRYREVWLTEDGVGSYSREMVPDVVLEFSDSEDGSGPRRVMVLDSKYRVESQLNDAISSIHTYRDALIAEATPSAQTDVRVVVAGFVVVPRMPESALEPDSWREQVVPEVLFRRQYQNRFGLGAVELKPGVGVPTVADKIRDLERRFLLGTRGRRIGSAPVGPPGQ